MQERQISKDDPFVITQREHDPDNGAKRVIIVGGEMPNFNVQASTKSEVRVERIEVPVIVKETQIVEVEKVIVQKELQIERVEIPIVVTEVREIIREVPVIQTEVKLVEVPVVIKETQYKEMSSLVKVAIAVQSLAVIILLLKILLK